MNPNIEYEKFTQEVYQTLVNTDVVNSTNVKHNIQLVGKSGQAHQIDVYWEYKIAGVVQCVAIECKNYNKPVPIGKVRDFHSVISDLNNVAGVMVTKSGYQKGAKEYAAHYGINLKELRTPKQGEAIIGEVELFIKASITHRLFVVDEEYARKEGVNLSLYKQRLDCFRITNENKWQKSKYIPLGLREDFVRDSRGEVIASFGDIEKDLPEEDFDLSISDAYISTREFGRLKINGIRYEHENKNESKIISIDAQEFTKAILKDALTNEIKLIGK